MSGNDRNAPCPCGSGIKYKRCCLPREVRALTRPQAQVQSEPLPSRDVEESAAMVQALVRWLERERNVSIGGLLAGLPPDLVDEFSIPLWLDLELYARPVEGRPLARRYLDEARRPVFPRQCEARLAGWVTIAEVVDVRADEGVTFLDCFTGERVEVRDVMASRSMQRGLTGLVFFGDRDGAPFVGSAYPHPLPPREASEVMGRIRKALKLGVRKKITREMMREWRVVSGLASYWADAVADYLSRPAPVLHNTDGDPLVHSVERFTFQEAQRDAVIARIARIKGAQEPEISEADDERETVFAVLGPGRSRTPGLDSVVLGRIIVPQGGGRLRIETNSERRADLLRGRLEKACGELVQRRARELQDVHALVERERAERGGERGRAHGDPRGGRNSEHVPGDEIPRSVQLSLLREFKAKHYAAWPDMTIPALGGKTPRQASKGTPKQRAALELLLKELEYGEEQLPADERFDVGAIRAELGMPRGR